jgi:hypothetical protein
MFEIIKYNHDKDGGWLERNSALADHPTFDLWRRGEESVSAAGVRIKPVPMRTPAAYGQSTYALNARCPKTRNNRTASCCPTKKSVFH